MDAGGMDDADDADDAEDVLFRAQTTTSVFVSPADPTTVRIGTLEEARPTYTVLPAAPPTSASTVRPTAAAPAPYNGSPTIVVQVRRRDGQVELFLDGFASPGEVEADAVHHRLYWHRGLHEDVESGTSVFSPLAIVACAEDGQHQLDDIRVSVWQQSTMDSAPPPTMISEAVLVPHRVSEPRCRVVYAPYPLTFTNPPTVTIYDWTKRRRYDLNRLWKTATDGAGLLASVFKNPSEVTRETLLTGLTRTGDVQVVELFSRLGQASIVACLGIVSMLYGWTLTATILSSWSVTTQAVFDRVSTMDGTVAAGTGWLTFINGLTFAQRLSAAAYGMGSVLSQVGSYFWSPERPELLKMRFTLPELTATIRRLAIVTSRNERIDTELVKRDLRKEMIVWAWMVAPEGNSDQTNTTPRPSDTRSTANPIWTVPNPIDLSNLVIDQVAVAVRTFVRIAVASRAGCDPARAVHELHCATGLDARSLGAAAMGILDQLWQLRTAIMQFDDALARGEHGWSDTHFWDPITRFFFGADAADTSASTRPTIAPGAGRRAWKDFLNRDDLGMARRETLLIVRKHLDEKLFAKFVDSEGEAQKLRLHLEQVTAPLERLLPIEKAAWLRVMPQRIVNASMATFRAPVDDALDHVETFMGDSTVREFSVHHDAVRAAASVMQISGIAIRRLVPKWEAHSAQRVVLVCACEADAVREGTWPASASASACTTLVIGTPLDVRMAAHRTATSEYGQQRRRLVLKRALQRAKPSPLEALKLKHDDTDLLVAGTFGALWSEELLGVHMLRDAHSAKRVQMLERASSRASARLRAAGGYLLRLTASLDDATPLQTTLPDLADASLIATQPGRDAGLLLGRLLFAQDHAAVRRALHGDIANAARAAMRIGKVFERRVPTALPYEPVASLFGRPTDGVAAHLRMCAVTQPWTRTEGERRRRSAAIEAATAAYPALRLLRDRYAAPPDGPAIARAHLALVEQEQQTHPTVPPGRDGTPCGDLRHRMARLRLLERIDVPRIVNDENAPAQDAIDALANQLSLAEVTTTPTSAAFHVPFGYGDDRPAPTPESPVVMFGSVPVYRDPLVAAYGLIEEGLAGRRSGDVRGTARVVLEPLTRCLVAAPDGGHRHSESEHPYTLQCTLDGYGAEIVRVRFIVSTPPPDVWEAPQRPNRDYAPGDACVAALRHAHTHPLSAGVSTMAWNAERIAQALVAAAASCPLAATFEVDLVLPPNERGVTEAYLETTQSMQAQQTRRRNVRRATVLLSELVYYARLHYASSGAATANGARRVGELTTAEQLQWAKDVANDADAGTDATATSRPPSVLERARANITSLLQKVDDAFKALKDELDELDELDRGTPTHWGAPPITDSAELRALQEARTTLNFTHSTQETEKVRMLRAQREEGRAVRKCLLNALGIGMAMSPVWDRVRAIAVDIPGEDVEGEPDPNSERGTATASVRRLQAAFGMANALRLSESCLVALMDV